MAKNKCPVNLGLYLTTYLTCLLWYFLALVFRHPMAFPFFLVRTIHIRHILAFWHIDVLARLLGFLFAHFFIIVSRLAFFNISGFTMHFLLIFTLFFVLHFTMFSRLKSTFFSNHHFTFFSILSITISFLSWNTFLCYIIPTFTSFRKKVSQEWFRTGLSIRVTFLDTDYQPK